MPTRERRTNCRWRGSWRGASCREAWRTSSMPTPRDPGWVRGGGEGKGERGRGRGEEGEGEGEVRAAARGDVHRLRRPPGTPAGWGEGERGRGRGGGGEGKRERGRGRGELPRGATCIVYADPPGPWLGEGRGRREGGEGEGEGERGRGRGGGGGASCREGRRTSSTPTPRDPGWVRGGGDGKGERGRLADASWARILCMQHWRISCLRFLCKFKVKAGKIWWNVSKLREIS